MSQFHFEVLEKALNDLCVLSSEVMGHINNKDYGLAKLKAEILWRKLVFFKVKEIDFEDNP